MYLDKDVESVWNEFDSCIKKVAKEVFRESKDVGNWLRKLIWLWNKKVQTIVKWERERERERERESNISLPQDVETILHMKILK